MRNLFYIGILSLIGLSCLGKQTQTAATEKQGKPNLAALLSVYELSEQTTAIVSNFSEIADSLSQFDKVFEQINSKDSINFRVFSLLYENRALPHYIQFYDTTAVYDLFQNKTLDNQIRPFIAKEYYVYGTKGLQKMAVKDIVFGLDECKTNIFAFTIPGFNTSQNGHPLIASTQELDLVYAEDFVAIEAKINQYYTSLKYDYADQIGHKVFARQGDLYYVYADDFKWKSFFEYGVTECFFPSRAIFKLEADGKVKPIWQDGLDLFGIPCD